jgi:tetratricopeptide (TPR) repeat protein
MLERRAWTEAGALKPQPSRFPYTQAMIHFARALGAAQQKDAAAAKTGIAELARIREQLDQSGESYWSEQVEIQRRGAIAWLALAEGRAGEAVSEMQTAAQLEDATEKSAVTPGPLAPARELLGDLLLQLKRPADALREYEATLRKEPNRFRSLYGAAQAASMAGDAVTARRHYQALLKICAKADTPARPELDQARRFVTRPAAR